MGQMNYNCFLDWIERAGLLTPECRGLSFLELPKDVRKRIELCVARLRVEFKHEEE